MRKFKPFDTLNDFAKLDYGKRCLSCNLGGRRTERCTSFQTEQAGGTSTDGAKAGSSSYML